MHKQAVSMLKPQVLELISAASENEKNLSMDWLSIIY